MPARLLAALTLFCLAACSAPAAQIAGPAPNAPPSFPVRACVNLAGAMEAPQEGDWGYHIRREDMARIKAAGFDTVRLPVKASAWTGPAPAFILHPGKMQRLDHVITEALAADLNVILDLHHFTEINENPRGEEARFLAIWAQFAERYADAPEGLFFELLNEPLGDKMTASMVERLNANALKIVRASNPNRVVIIGGPRWNTIEGLEGFSPPADANLVATIHYYAPYEFSHAGAAWLPNPPHFPRDWGTPEDHYALARDFDEAAAWARANGVHLFLGEFGVAQEVRADQRALWASAVREAAEARQMSWCYFDWATSFKLYDTKTEAWVAPLRDALIPKRIEAADLGPQ